MKKILTYLLGVILLTQLAQAKEQVFEGSATDSVFTTGRYTEGIGIVDFDIKYKLSIFMGDPLIKIKGKYTINSASLITTKSNEFIVGSLPQDVQDKLSVNSVKATLEFYDGSRRKLKVNADLGAMGKQGEWSFNTPESRNWDKFLYTTSPSKEYLSASEAKKAYRKMALSKVYIENKDIKYNVLQAELYAYQQSHNKEKQKAKKKYGVTMSQDEIDKKKAFLKDKQSKLSGSNYTDKERYLLAAIEQAKKQNEPENVAIFKKRLNGLYRANSYFKTEFKKLNREEKKVQAYNKKVRAIDKKYDRKISKANSQHYKIEQMREDKIARLKKNGVKGSEEGVFIDDRTGLMWQDNEEINEGYYSWYNAKEYCKDLELNGYTDWHLPSADEMGYEHKKRFTFKYPNKDGYYIFWTSTADGNDYKVGDYYVTGRGSPNYRRNVRCVRDMN